MGCSSKRRIIQADMVGGVPFPFDVTYRVNNVAASLAGFTSRAELRETIGGPIIAAWDDDSIEVTRDDPAGLWLLTIPGLATAGYTFNTAYLDVLFSKPDDGMRSDIVHITRYPGVTQPEVV